MERLDFLVTFLAMKKVTNPPHDSDELEHFIQAKEYSARTAISF